MTKMNTKIPNKQKHIKETMATNKKKKHKEIMVFDIIESVI